MIESIRLRIILAYFRWVMKLMPHEIDTMQISLRKDLTEIKPRFYIGRRVIVTDYESSFFGWSGVVCEMNEFGVIRVEFEGPAKAVIRFEGETIKGIVSSFGPKQLEVDDQKEK